MIWIPTRPQWTTQKPGVSSSPFWSPLQPASRLWWSSSSSSSSPLDANWVGRWWTDSRWHSLNTKYISHNWSQRREGGRCNSFGKTGSENIEAKWLMGRQDFLNIPSSCIRELGRNGGQIMLIIPLQPLPASSDWDQTSQWMSSRVINYYGCENKSTNRLDNNQCIIKGIYVKHEWNRHLLNSWNRERGGSDVVSDDT